MSEPADILETHAPYRLALYIDPYPEEPYDDGQSPLLRLEYRGSGSWTAEHVMVGARPTDDDSRIEEAARRWGYGNRRELLDRYLRAYFGTTQIVSYGPNQMTDYTYVTYDTARWREYTGFTPEHPMQPGSVNLNEWKAYIEGEVYTWAIEKNIIWTADDDELNLDDKGSWEPVDSCGGYYGSEWAEEVAREEWQSFLARKGLLRCATVGHGDRSATHMIRYLDGGGAKVITEYVCTECAASYANRPSLRAFEAHRLTTDETPEPEIQNGTCIITGQPGENPDDCTTHDHEEI